MWTNDHWPIIDHWSANNCPIADHWFNIINCLDYWSIHRLVKKFSKIVERNFKRNFTSRKQISIFFVKKKKDDEETDEAAAFNQDSSKLSFNIHFFFFFFFLELRIKERPNCMATVVHEERNEKRRGYFIEVISNDFETYLV